ncbi:MAG: Hsp20/alpha crystallin family protein [Anaerolineae bacterium]
MADIVRWEPFKDMLSLREAMNRLFEDSFIRPSAWPLPFEGETVGMPVDVIEGKDNVVVKASVPGLKPEDIDVSITGDTLTIKGETKSEEKVEQGSYIRQERRYGKFERSLQLPSLVVADKADAKFEHGVLTLTLPKAEEVKPKTIKVKTK